MVKKGDGHLLQSSILVIKFGSAAGMKSLGIIRTELVAAIRQHYNPKSSAIVQCYKFNCRFRKEGESVVQYLLELHALSKCEIGDEAVQKKLLAEDGLAMKRVADIALPMETDAKNATTLQGARQ